MTLTRRTVLGSAIGFALDSALAASPANSLQNQVLEKNGAPPPLSAASRSAEFLAKAAADIPPLVTTIVANPRTVRTVRDDGTFLRWRIESAPEAEAIERNIYKSGNTVLLDFSRHLTGFLSLEVEGIGINIDSPARIRFTFGEVPGDVAEDFYPFKGTLAEAWLPDEVFNLDPLPCSFTVPRRHAFRYLRIDVISTSPKFSVKFSNIRAHAISSAQAQALPLLAGVSSENRQIDRVAVTTLRDCMQTVFEDGPRRDQRLWIGDLRLQALASYAAFPNHHLVRRCLYLLAAYPQDNGMLTACVFEKPAPRRAGDVILDYACIYAVLLREYLDQSGDLAACRDLWPSVLRQMELASAYVNSDGLFVDPKSLWIFIDWNEALQRDAAMQGVIIFALRNAHVLARRLGDTASARRFATQAEKMSEAARRSFLDPTAGLFVSGPDRQVSWASQAWLTLAGALPADECVTLLKRAVASREILAPSTPYLYHYVVEALVMHGLNREAEAVIASYWGQMVRRGADSFWEVYDPANSLTSPYGDVHLNSFCHAWGCTPAYFFRKFNLGSSSA